MDWNEIGGIGDQIGGWVTGTVDSIGRAANGSRDGSSNPPPTIIVQPPAETAPAAPDYTPIILAGVALAFVALLMRS
jgi:hypothetical protein